MSYTVINGKRYDNDKIVANVTPEPVQATVVVESRAHGKEAFIEFNGEDSWNSKVLIDSGGMWVSADVLAALNAAQPSSSGRRTISWRNV